MSDQPESPFVTKTSSEIFGELLEHVTAGIVKIDNEEETFESGTDTYDLLCGSPDITNGLLVEVNRIWGERSSSFFEFIEGTDYTVDIDNNQITFLNDPDDTTLFYISYRYDQQFVSGITDISDGSVTNVLLTSIARNISAAWQSLELLKASAYIDTAQGDDLDEVLTLVGVTRNLDSVSSGFVTFYRATASGDSEIPINTQVVANTADGNIIFETTAAAWFRDGFTSVRAPVQALSAYAGLQSNMAPNKIVQLAGSAGGASRVNNPSYYTDYEVLDIIEGNYTYDMVYSPRRVLNTEGFTGTSPPWGVTDKGIVGIWSWHDTDMDTASWTTTNVTVSSDTLATGVIKCVPTATDGLIAQTFAVDLNQYNHVFVMTRGTNNDTFEVRVNSNTVSMYEFQNTTSYSASSFRTPMTLYVGDHGETQTTTSTFEVVFGSTNTAWVDFVGVGQELEEISGYLSSEDEVKINYTAKQVNFWFEDANSNFFNKYDGDDEDGHRDYAFVYYQWDNHVSGGGDEETDEHLRQRGREALTVAAKGTKDAIRNAVLEVEGVTQCEVVDWNDDSTITPGTCHVNVSARGFVLSPALNQDIVDAIDAVRAAGIQVKIFAPLVRYTNFTLNAIYDDSIPDYVGITGEATLSAMVSSAMDDFFADAKINEALYFSDICGFVIKEVRGVDAADVTWTDSSEPTISDDDYAGSYAWNSEYCLDSPSDTTPRISGFKQDATIIVQRGNSITIDLWKKSQYR